MAAMYRDDPLPDLGGLRILLAEDNETNQLVAGEMLRAMGAVVEIAADGAEALELAAARSYDALVVDIEMPRVSGEEVIRMIRAAAEPLASRPMIALTAFPREELGARLMAAGADAVLSKPIGGIAALGRAILAPLEARRAAAARTPPPPDALRAAGAAAADSDYAPSALDALRRSVGPELMDELLGKLLTDIAAAAETVRLASAPPEPDALRRASHVLMAVAGQAGAGTLARRAATLNAAARAADLDACAAAAPAVLSAAAGALLRLARARDEEARG